MSRISTINTWFFSDTDLVSHWLYNASSCQSLQCQVIIAAVCQSVPVNWIRKEHSHSLYILPKNKSNLSGCGFLWGWWVFLLVISAYLSSHRVHNKPTCALPIPWALCDILRVWDWQWKQWEQQVLFHDSSSPFQPATHQFQECWFQAMRFTKVAPR